MIQTLAITRTIIIGTALGLSMLTSAPVLAQDIPTFEITIENGVVTPTHVEVPKGVDVNLVVTNAGDAIAEFESKSLHIERLVPAGTTRTLTLHSLKAGRYEFVDEYTEDQDTAHGFIEAK